MLEHLDDVDWNSLEHAYGSASDVPDMIRALGSDDDELCQEALHAAYGNIFHQGTRYTATPKAIPFLIEIASQPRMKQLDDLLSLLVHCVAGYFSPVGGPRTGSGPIFGEPPEPMSDYGETLEILEGCERAAEPAVPLCLRLLSHADREVRANACYLLAALRQFAARYEVVPRLRDHLSRETEPHVRAMTAFALTHLLPMSETSLLEQLVRDDRDGIVRVIAAMGCVRRGSKAPELASLLIQWMSDEGLGAAYTELPFHADDLAGDLASLLTLLDRDVLRTALPTLVERLRTADDFGVVGILDAALAAVFGGDPLPETPNAEQREVLETLARNQAFWSIGNALTLLMDRNLPSMREEMAEYLGITVEHDPIEAARIGARSMGMFGPERAIEEWQKVIDLSPDDLEARCQLGLALVATEQTDAAVPHLRRALELGPTGDDLLGRLWFGLGLSLHRAGSTEEALAAFTEAETHLGGEARDMARQNRVAMLQRLGRAEEALALRTEDERETSDELFHYGLAQVKAGKYADCIATITRVLEQEPDHALALYTIACAYALSGDAEKAFASIERAIESDPDLAPDIAGDSDFDNIRDDPRFIELVGGN